MREETSMYRRRWQCQLQPIAKLLGRLQANPVWKQQTRAGVRSRRTLDSSDQGCACTLSSFKSVGVSLGTYIARSTALAYFSVLGPTILT